MLRKSKQTAAKKPTKIMMLVALKIYLKRNERKSNFPSIPWSLLRLFNDFMQLVGSECIKRDYYSSECQVHSRANHVTTSAISYGVKAILLKRRKHLDGSDYIRRNNEYNGIHSIQRKCL